MNKLPRKIGLIILSLIVIALIIFAAWYFMTGFIKDNYAERLVKPIGESLQNEGANFACSGGDNGRGIDNKAPYYRAYYKVRGDKDAAISILNKAASQNGYTLTHASPTNRGSLNAVADLYIDRWYFDETSKQNTYADLKQGPVKLAAIVDGPGSEDSCTSGKTVEDGHTMVGIEIRLPDFK